MKEDGKRMWEKGDRPQLSPTFPCITNDSKRYINRKLTMSSDCASRKP